jgi:Na+-transporting NADH:ubiquinone oxidoreductase subunit C
MQNNIKIYLYVLVMTSISAAVLSFLYNVLDPLQAKNKEDAKKRSILNSLPDVKADIDFDKTVKITLLDATGKVIFTQKEDTKTEDIDKQMAELNKRGQGVKYGKLIDVDLALEEIFPLDKRIYPVYSYVSAGKTTQIVSIRGSGLWDKIWGFISMDYKDGKWTISGVNFEHKAETPGLGAEIKDSKDFKDQFKGKQIYDDAGKYVSVAVVKVPKNKNWEVKSISGSTVTSVGVSEMMNRGISYYLPYLDAVSGKALTEKK